MGLMGKQAVGCLAVSFAESDFMPYVSLQKKQEIRHKTGLKYLLFFLSGIIVIKKKMTD